MPMQRMRDRLGGPLHHNQSKPMNNDHISNIFEAKKKIVELERQKAELDKPKPKNALAWLFVALLAIITTGQTPLETRSLGALGCQQGS